LKFALGPYRVLSDNMLSETEGFSPPWCDMTNFYCSLLEIPIMSDLPDS